MKGNWKTAVLTAGGKAYTVADLAAACEASIEASLAALPDIFPEPEVSERFAKSVERLDRRYVRGVALRRAGRAAAAVFLALILCFSAFLTVNAQARGALMNWWKELTSESAVYWFEGSGQEQGAAAGSYAPSWVPEGLKLVREAQRGSFASLFYEGDAGMLAFEYSMGDVKGAYEIVGEDEGRRQTPSAKPSQQ